MSSLLKIRLCLGSIIAHELEIEVDSDIIVSHCQKQLSVVLIDANKGRRSMLNRSMQEYACQILVEFEHTRELKNQLRIAQPDLLVVAYDQIELGSLQDIANELKYYPLPVVVFAEQETPQAISLAIKAGVSAFVVDDIQPHRFRAIFEVARVRFNEQKKLKEELFKTKTQLENRKILDKAKGLLMQSQQLTEDEAYKKIRNTAMTKGITITQVASNLVDAFELLHE